MLLVHSLGGGTGSGLGSRLLEAVRDEYPKATLLDAVVAPFSAGDTPLQHYNTVLSLASAHEHADAVLFFDNDDVLRRARAAKRAGGGARLSAGATPSAVADSRARALNDKTQVDTKELNDVISEALTSVIMPTRYRKRLGRRRRGSDGGRGVKGKDVGPGWHDLRDDAEPDTAFDGSVLTGGQTASPAKGSGKAAPPSRSSPAGVRRFGTSTDEDDEDGEFGGRGGWIAASVRSGSGGVGSSVGAGAGAGAGSGKGGSATSAATSNAASTVDAILSGKATVSVGGSAVTSTASASASSTPVGTVCPFDAAAFVQDLVISPTQKFLDLRCVTPSAPPGSRAGVLTADSPAASWVALADAMVDALPRYDKASRPVTTYASRIIARGATQTDCDSVDPTLPAPEGAEGDGAAAGSGGGAGKGGRGGRSGARVGTVRTSPVGMKPIPPHWPGLPRTSEWERVSMMLTRAQGFAPDADLSARRTAVLTPLPVYTSSSAPRKHVRTLTVASNNDIFVAPLVRTLTRAEELLSVRAYVHWYERYGVDGESITAAMSSLLDVVDVYRPGGMAIARDEAAAAAVAAAERELNAIPGGGAHGAVFGEGDLADGGDGDEGEEGEEGEGEGDDEYAFEDGAPGDDEENGGYDGGGKDGYD